MSDGSEHGWVADRTRFLNETTTWPIYYSATTAVTSYKATGPSGSLFGNKNSLLGNLGGLLGDENGSTWSIAQSISSNPGASPGLRPASAFESIGIYAGGSMVLSAKRTAPSVQIYTKDRYDLYLNDKTFRFVCRYLHETPSDVAIGDQCRGLIYSMSAIEMGTTSMINQIAFETTKQTELLRLL